MENNYSVAISCHSDLGYIEYTADTGMVLKTSLEGAYLKVGNGYLKCEIVVDE